MPSNENVDEAFWDRADSFIHLANKQSDSADVGKVSASLLYAAARFNAFIVASQSPSSEALQATKQEALDYFSNQYRQMLEDNLNDYVANHGKYVGGG